MSNAQRIALVGVIFLTHSVTAKKQNALSPTVIEKHTKTNTLVKLQPQATSSATLPSQKIKKKLEEKPQKQTVRITNKITDKMMSYTKFYQTVKPDMFAVRVNGKEIPQNQTKTIEVTGGTVDVVYNFNFKNMATGPRELSCAIPHDATSMEMTFNWHDTERVKLTKSPSQKASTS